MKTRDYILGLLLLSGCTDMQEDRYKNNSVTNQQNSSYSDTTRTNSVLQNELKLSSRIYGENIISGKVQPSDNEQTLALLDSLKSNDHDTRNFSFRVYKTIVVKSDGALSEAISGYIKTYFSLHPKEFIVNYNKLNNQEKFLTHESLAFEFYASGTEHKKDLDDFFESIVYRCKECTENDNRILKELKSILESIVGGMEE